MGIKSMFTDAGRQVRAVKIKVDGEDHEVFVGKLSSMQSKKMIEFLKDQNPMDMNVYLVQCASYDDLNGTRSFTDTDADTKCIRSAPVQFVKALADAILDFNRFDVEDATKN